MSHRFLVSALILLALAAALFLAVDIPAMGWGVHPFLLFNRVMMGLIVLISLASAIVAYRKVP